MYCFTSLLNTYIGVIMQLIHHSPCLFPCLLQLYPCRPPVGALSCDLSVTWDMWPETSAYNELFLQQFTVAHPIFTPLHCAFLSLYQCKLHDSKTVSSNPIHVITSYFSGNDHNWWPSWQNKFLQIYTRHSLCLVRCNGSHNYCQCG